ncbi:hypothetical protein EPN42_13320 [bacterium]|nr:MAG: hypothetical protein EPN42_13320 [bacterium]
MISKGSRSGCSSGTRSVFRASAPLSRRMRTVLLRPAAVVFLALLAGCGGGGGAPTVAPAPTGQSVPAIYDDWTTYAHDGQRTGFEQLPTGITTSTVGTLTLAWRNTGVDPACVRAAQSATVFVDQASPLAANGLVYVADVCGVVTALNRDNGTLVWQTRLPVAGSVSGVYGTPTLANGKLFVPVWGTQSPTARGGYLAALDAMTGAVVWETQPLMYGNMRSDPIVANGRVFEGVSGGDPDTGYVTGGIMAFDELTGQQIPNTFPIVPSLSIGSLNEGGGSWSPISYDGTSLYFGTGNTKNNLGYQDSVLAISPSTLALTATVAATYDSAGLGSSDEDVGGGELLWGGNLYFESKNGYYYGYSLATPSNPSAQFKTLVNLHAPPGGFGAIWTPTTNGAVIAVSSGYNRGNYNSDLDVFPVGSGAKICKLEATNSSLYSYAAFVNGIGFTGIDNGVPSGTPDGGITGPAPWFVAFDNNCGILWKANPTDILGYFYAGPAVVESGVYAIDNAGNVYAWKLPSRMTASTLRRREDSIQPGKRLHFWYGHYIPGHLGPHLY